MKLELGTSQNGEIVKIDTEKEKHILITGDTGVGKTHLLQLILKQLIDSGKTIVIVDMRIPNEFGSYYRQHCTIINDNQKLLEALLALTEANKETYLVINGASWLEKDIYIWGYFWGKIKATFLKLIEQNNPKLKIIIENQSMYAIPQKAMENFSVVISGRYGNPKESLMALGNLDATELWDIKGNFILKNDRGNRKFRSDDLKSL